MKPYFLCSSFGYSWDCDPIFTIGVWSGLIVAVGFALVVGWAVGYIASIATPDKFDDAHKTKPISVPNSDR